MSADNWTYCPKCQTNTSSERDKALEKAEQEYGKIPVSEYKDLIAKAVRLSDDRPDMTLREDYEQGMQDGGVYFISYHCCCAKCGWSFKFEREEKAL